jgi:hypothetical protein
MWNQPPLHQRNLPDGFFWMLPNYGYGLGWSDVVARIPVIIPRSSLEILLDDLLPLREPIPSADWEIMADRIA